MYRCTATWDDANANADGLRWDAMPFRPPPKIVTAKIKIGKELQGTEKIDSEKATMQMKSK